MMIYQIRNVWHAIILAKLAQNLLVATPAAVLMILGKMILLLDFVNAYKDIIMMEKIEYVSNAMLPA